MTASTSVTDDPHSVGLFDDVAYNVGAKLEWAIGRIMRMRNTERGTVEYVKPVSLDKDKNKRVVLILNTYEKAHDKYVYSSLKYIQISLDKVVMKVSMEKDGTDFVISSSDQRQLQSFVDNVKAKITHSTTPKRNTNCTVTDAGRVVVVHEPDLGQTSGERKSKRKRKNVTYEYK